MMKTIRTVLFRSIAIIIYCWVFVSSADERRFGYDENGNLLQASVLYDASGNLILNSGLFYEYNDANRLVRVRLGSEIGPILEEYTYDYRGQRFKKDSDIHVCKKGSGCEYISYDFQGNPFPYERKLTQTTFYIGKHYEEKLSRAMVVVDEKETPAFRQETNHYFANGQRVAKNVKTEQVELGTDGVGLIVETSDKEFFLTNHLGSTDVVLSEDGDVIADLGYYPFGEIRKPSKESHSYTGKEKDHKTNNYYYEARYYDAGMRTFIQADTIVPEIYDPQSLNRYAYVRNNPLKFVDPTGHVIFMVQTGSDNSPPKDVAGDLITDKINNYSKTEICFGLCYSRKVAENSDGSFSYEGSFEGIGLGFNINEKGYEKSKPAEGNQSTFAGSSSSLSVNGKIRNQFVSIETDGNELKLNTEVPFFKVSITAKNNSYPEISVGLTPFKVKVGASIGSISHKRDGLSRQQANELNDPYVTDHGLIFTTRPTDL